MLKHRRSYAIVAVSDLDRARAFYRDTLGLKLQSEDAENGVLSFRTGDTSLTVYRSEFAGTNRANAVLWEMKGDLEETVRDLRGKGVTFERYDFPGMTFRDGLHEADGAKHAWLKDPDGNLLHLVEGM